MGVETTPKLVHAEARDAAIDEPLPEGGLQRRTMHIHIGAVSRCLESEVDKMIAQLGAVRAIDFELRGRRAAR